MGVIRVCLHLQSIMLYWTAGGGLAFAIGKSTSHDPAPGLAWINILDERLWFRLSSSSQFECLKA